MNEMKIEYQEIDLSKVVKFFVDGYYQKPETFEYFIDPAKNKVILKLFLKVK